MNSSLLRQSLPLLGTLLYVIFFTLNADASDSKSTQSHLRKWTRLEIPGATCGSGHPYAIWYEKRDSQKLAAEFMGGGACWSKATCFGGKLKAWMFPLPQLPAMSAMQLPFEKHSPFWDHSMIYFPYCTGDVHAGNHIADYDGKKTNHMGYTNVQKALAHLKEQNIFNFDGLRELALFGSSAGALGAIAHTHSFDQVVPATAIRTLIADAPGLHFGKTFWHKFTDRIVGDFKTTFANLGVSFTREDYLLAKYIPTICEYLSNWNVGILQGSRDVVMSRVFGEISGEDHEKAVYGPYGVYEMTRKTANCSSWVPKTPQHTFLIVNVPLSRAGAMNALEFTQEVVQGVTGNSYR